MQIQPYLFFDGRCEEAIHFYQGAVGAELQMMMRHKDNPTAPPAGGAHARRRSSNTDFVCPRRSEQNEATKKRRAAEGIVERAKRWLFIKAVLHLWQTTGFAHPCQGKTN